MTEATATSCLFCQIVAGARPANIVHRNAQVTAFRDIHPQAPTHILVVPNRHIRSLSEAQVEDAPLLGALLAQAAEIARQEGLTGYRLVVNNGAEAGQSVWHLHVHILGGRRLTWPPG
jgi:histidine triad (HIT) family protein